MRNEKLKIMHVRDSSGIYGAERVILTLGNKLRKDTFDFKLLCMQRRVARSQILNSTASELGIDTINLPTRGKLDWSAIKRLRTVLENYNVDIVHSHDFKSDFYVMLASHGTNIKKIATAHGSTRDSIIKRVYLEIDENFIYRKMDRIVAVSDGVARGLKKKGIQQKQICVIKNGFDLELLKRQNNQAENKRNLHIRSDKTNFAIVGRLYPDKGHRFFLQAFAKTISVHPKAVLLIIGDGPARKSIEDQIKALGLENFVNMCGVVNNMQEVYERINCLVIPSLREGLPYVLLEAAANLVPVLATAVGDIPQLIEDGKTGYLVKPGSAVELEDRTGRFLSQKDNIKQMVENCYNLFKKKFSADRMVRETEDLYLSLFDVD